MTIEQYLQGKVDFNLSEANIAAILVDRGVSAGADMATLTEKQRDLCLADLYMLLAYSSSSSSGEYESDGGWQKQKASKNVYDRSGYKEMAQRLYAKWDDEAANTATSRITLKPLY